MAGSAVVLALTLGSSAWTPLQPAVPRTTQRASIPHAHLACSRRAAFALPLAAITWPVAAHAADKEAALLADLKAVRVALEPLPALLDEEKWDAVRSVLKTPPVGNLWNLGEVCFAIHRPNGFLSQSLSSIITCSCNSPKTPSASLRSSGMMSNYLSWLMTSLARYSSRINLPTITISSTTNQGMEKSRSRSQKIRSWLPPRRLVNCSAALDGSVDHDVAWDCL
mmetsp:Transcript_11507/g.29473  ORF Transcript_11507/g.29473 Transcript_11507/m.29473 type:complete len:224 (-) Transcript_11507:241-912(-)